MAKLDDQIVKLENTYKITDEWPLKTWKRFLDDCFGIWIDSIDKGIESLPQTLII